jgi:hypothetical protein
MASKCASKTLFVGNLHASLEETDLLEIFKPFGRIVECCKRWCHYGFIQFATEDEARLAFNNLNGSRIRGRPMRIEFQRKKIRNLAALLEAEAQSKNHMANVDGASPLHNLYDGENTENISPTSIDYHQYGHFDPYGHSLASTDDNFKINFPYASQDDGFLYISNSNETQLVSQFSFMDTLPLTIRDLNIQQAPISKQKSFEDLSDNSIAKEIANSVLLSSAKKPTSQGEAVMDKKSTAWFNYLLDKAAQYPAARGIYKTNDNASSHSISSSCSSSSPRSPINHNTSPSVKNSSANDTSIVLYRSLNTSNTIFVQPTDILEPLEIGEFNEYKLFPQTSSGDQLYSFQMSSPKRPRNKESSLDMLVELTPPSSLSTSCSSSSHTSPVRSPSASIVINKARLSAQKLFSEH